MEVNPGELTPRELYRLLISCVVPRPICWISTRSREGVGNLAPFSFFGGVTATPPTVMVSVGRRKGVAKDTAQNLLQLPEAVIHIPSRPLAEAMVATSAEVGPEIDEFELAGLATVPARLVAPVRLRDAAVAMEGRVVHHQEVGRGPVDLFLLEVVAFHLDDGILDERNLPDPSKLRAVGRMGGLAYCDSGEVFELERPR